MTMRGGGFEIDVGNEVESLVSTLALYEPAFDRAVFNAMKKLSRWLAYHSARETSAQLQIKAAPIRRRFKAYFSKTGNSQAKVWIGLNPIQLNHFKNAKYSPVGGGEIYVPGLGDTFSESFFSDNIGPSKRDGKMRAWTRDSSLPGGVELTKASIEPEVMESMSRWETRATVRFKELLQQEVNFEISKIKQ